MKAQTSKIVKALRVFISIVLVMSCLVGCSDVKPPTRDAAAEKAAAAAQAAAEAARLKEEGSAKIETIPNPDEELEERVFLNELEEIGEELLLPFSIKVPNKQPADLTPTISLGENFYAAPSDKWSIKLGKDFVEMYHTQASGIVVKFTPVKVSKEYLIDDMLEELNTFRDSFVQKGEPTYKICFNSDKLVGHEISFEIKHDEKAMNMTAGILGGRKTVLVYTINYFIPEEGVSEIQESIDVLFSTLMQDKKKVVRK